MTAVLAWTDHLPVARYCVDVFLLLHDLMISLAFFNISYQLRYNTRLRAVPQCLAESLNAVLSRMSGCSPEVKSGIAGMAGITSERGEYHPHAEEGGKRDGSLRKTIDLTGFSMQMLIGLIIQRGGHILSWFVIGHGGSSLFSSSIPFWCDMILAVCIAWCCYEVYRKRASYKREDDTWGFHALGIAKRSFWMQFALLYLLAGVMAGVETSLSHKNHSVFDDPAQLFTAYLSHIENLCIIPQLFLFERSKKITSLLGDFSICCVADKFFMLGYWYSWLCAIQGNRVHSDVILSVIILFNIIVQGITLLFCTRFVYYYGKALNDSKRAATVDIPMSEHLV